MGKRMDGGNLGDEVLGAATVQCPLPVEMAAYDGLPASVRRELREAMFPLSAVGVSQVLAEFGEAVAARVVVLMDRKILEQARRDG